MLKMLGVWMIIGSCSALGLSLSREMTARQHALREQIKALQVIKTEILFRRAPLQEIASLLEHACDGRTADFYRLTVQTALKKGMTLQSSALRHRGRLHRMGLNKDDESAIMDVLQVLGKYDGAAQAETINRSIARLERSLAALREESASKGRLYRAIGVTAGITLALIVI